MSDPTPDGPGPESPTTAAPDAAGNAAGDGQLPWTGVDASDSAPAMTLPAAGQPATGRPGRPPGRRGHLMSWIVVIVVAAAASILIRTFVVQTFYVPSSSMYPTLQTGDRILVLKVGYSLQRGAIVVFHHPKNDLEPPLNEDLVKRIIGLPGETISSKGNTVYINGKPLAEPYLPKGTILDPAIQTQKIPPGCYFMMGDYRNDSYDSRAWGPVPASTIVGQVFLVVWRDGHPVFHTR